MFPEEIRDRIHKHPFEPFRIYVSDGSHYDVVHHDFAFVTARVVIVATSVSKREDLPDKTVHIDPEHITRVEAIRNLPKRRRARRASGT